MGITASKSSALSIFTTLIFEMQLINGALFLNVTTLLLLLFFFLIYLFFFAPVGLTIVIVPFTTIYAPLKSHKSGLNIDFLILISLLTL